MRLQYAGRLAAFCLIIGSVVLLGCLPATSTAGAPAHTSVSPKPAADPGILDAAGLVCLGVMSVGLAGRRPRTSDSDAESDIMFERSGHAMLVIGSDHVILRANSAAHACFGFQHGELSGISLSQLTEVEGVLKLAEAAGTHPCLDSFAAKLHEGYVLDDHVPFLKTSGERIILRLTAASLGDGGYFLMGCDVTEHWNIELKLKDMSDDMEMLNCVLQRQSEELAETNRRLQHLATIDPLTGVPNRRFFDEMLKIHLSECRSSGEPVSLLFIDVDHFKRLNDTYGHPAGDEVLQLLANILLRGTRSTDVVSRIGGEEFAVILPKSHQEQAQAAADRIRGLVLQSPWPYSDITVSIGMVTRPAASVKLEELIRLADGALYAAKNGGRNQIAAA